MSDDPGLLILAIVTTLAVLSLLAQIEKRWVPIYPGSGDEPADHKEVPTHEDEEHE